jgi:TolA-binding protein
MSLRLRDLHELYHSKTVEEAKLIANLGADVYERAHDKLYKEWQKHQSEDDLVKADIYRKEGGAHMLESMKAKLLAGDAAISRIESLTATIDAEVSYRIQAELEKQSLTFELKKVAPLQQRLSQFEGKEELITLLKQQTAHLTEKLELKEQRIQELESKHKQSSHAIGKEGEQTVLSMIRDKVLPVFPFSRVEDKTGVEHAADFHVWTMPSPNKTVKMLIDAKKYKTPIKMVEIKKLHADVDADDEAQAGLMLSLDSGIYNFHQFEIGVTEKQKHIMYISMEGMGVEEKCRTLIWAIRVLTSIAGETDKEKQQSMILKVELFISEIEKSVKDLDTSVRLCQKTLDSMRSARESLYTRLTKYRDGSIEEADAQKMESISVETHVKCKGVNSEGNPCGYKPTHGQEYCKRHTK